ncbi:WAP four-disulfide core domain protein 8-like [Spea bombifrons]|uniref:WAP four-disulfide core domain protein 8-like n=1 Tax=Spea bombifrons TaxID=233779 RepID=UPI0023491631|nr:WAP four-disulfide core domain protein 8-like [Spea bombifrons]
MACADVLPGPEESCPSYDIKDAGSLQCPFIFCTSDNDCRLDQKCCLSDESQKCVKPQPDVLNVCPPFDPAICPLARPGPDECKTDVQCPRDKKCCCSNCGWKCVPPVQVKYGRCPPILAKCKTPTPVPKCKQDSDCPNKKKCCDICGKSCWDPEEEPFGSCPDAGIAEAKSLRCSSVTCSRDADCAADEKCCASRGKQQCVKSPTEVTTVCPPSKAITCVSGKAQSDDCRSDADCPKSKKCCCSSCGAKCVYPIKREIMIGIPTSFTKVSSSNLRDILIALGKAGRCPLVQTICAAFPSDPQCDTDTDCPGDKKCCDICGRVCSDPKPGNV